MDHLTSVDFDLAEAGGLPPSGTEVWSVAPATSPDGSIDGLAALGLLAEWLGAAAFALRHPDLRLLARAADRWRRTAAGDWAYPLPHRSAAPPWTRRPDATIQDRVNQLLESADPVAASAAQLRLWWGSSRRDAADPAGRIERRLPGAVRAASRAARRDQRTANPMHAAAELQQRTVPSAFVPPMAVLIALDRMEGRRSR